MPATSIPTANPEAVGLSSDGLARIDRFFEREQMAALVYGSMKGD